MIGCPAPPPAPPAIQPDFRGIEPPATGHARLYLLRPAFNELSHADLPSFEIDGGETVILANGAYTDFQLTPGRHHLTVRPSAHDSDIWNGDYDFAVDSDTTYFVAVWNDVEHHSTIKVPGLVPFLIANSLTRDKNVALRIELVGQDDALPVLRMSRYAPKTPRG